MLSSNNVGRCARASPRQPAQSRIWRLKRKFQVARSNVAPLLVREARCALLEEGGHSLLLVGCREQGVEEPPFE